MAGGTRRVCRRRQLAAMGPSKAAGDGSADAKLAAPPTKTFQAFMGYSCFSFGRDLMRLGYIRIFVDWRVSQVFGEGRTTGTKQQGQDRRRRACDENGRSRWM